MRNLKIRKVVYWVNVYESSGAGSPALSGIRGCEMVVVLLCSVYVV